MIPKETKYNLHYDDVRVVSLDMKVVLVPH